MKSLKFVCAFVAIFFYLNSSHAASPYVCDAKHATKEAVLTWCKTKCAYKSNDDNGKECWFCAAKGTPGNGTPDNPDCPDEAGKVFRQGSGTQPKSQGGVTK